ncbi:MULTISPECIES: metalloregulator ArsR/SmtB family transcription factor [Bacillales]|jgi:ArsR family transcriptional regulator|uniref:Transcriptional regulator n=1 Tax=Brevibacillus aydinogluensis TaxID=927786 RepID=A0AA48MAK2_9BACL|nr:MULTISPECIES: metalloregulator ArsR/SmtB family transcription factor [Bacillales]REK60928.1 MAG: ArsR family transcriptional regulator [Brevibacillus sp.]MBR8661527.1 winged helix-turn-helix transcriptional regulator [Brevibacillus sp. NL20B1]MDT3417880.1 ArsR family transcriptional regulator [Brevibacillus aydinogluensis]NNV03254.1 ArsR family transcriptional regulator [Brevibacillus sp. MCWH]UFJ62571.1 winged helix-turn-helix transcriptional regulator [Anoxybacillus sediminis]
MDVDLTQVLYLSEIYKLLGDKTRLTIMALLQVQSFCVRDLVEILQTSQPSVSQHLAKLKTHGLVKEKRMGPWVFYSLNTECPPAVKQILSHLPDLSPLIKEKKQASVQSLA